MLSLHHEHGSIDRLVMCNLINRVRPIADECAAWTIDGEVEPVRMRQSNAILFLELFKLFDERVALEFGGIGNLRDLAGRDLDFELRADVAERLGIEIQPG